jgi:hypothetical protein
MGFYENHFRPCSAANQVMCRKATADASTDDRNGLLCLHDSTVVLMKRIENFQIVIAYKQT